MPKRSLSQSDVMSPVDLSLLLWLILSVSWELLTSVLPVAVGALIAIIGVGMQLRHDRVERERARRWEVKRDIFLGAIGAVGDYQAYLMELGNAAIDVDAASREMAGKLRPLTQVDIIGSTVTLTAMGKLADSIQAATYRIMEERIPLLKVDTDLSVARKFEERAEAVLGDVASGRLNVSPEELNQIHKEAKDLNAKVGALLRERRDVASALTRAAVEENGKIGLLRVEALAAMRSELGFETDRTFLDESAARSAQLTQDGVAHLDRRVAEILRYDDAGPEARRKGTGTDT